MSDDLKIRIGAEIPELKRVMREVRKELASIGNVSTNTGAIEKTSAAAKQAAKDITAAEREKAKAAKLAARESTDAAVKAARESAAAQKLAAKEVTAAIIAETRARTQAEKDAARTSQQLARTQAAAAKQAAKEAATISGAADKARREEARKLGQAAPQVTDIAVGLATGQSPLMILLQQGGQLRDLFGGIGPAIKAVAASVATLITPVTVLVSIIGGLGIAYIKGQAEGDKFRRTLIATGNAAGVTAGQLLDAAADIDNNVAGSTRGSAAETLNAIAASGKIAADQVEAVAKAAEQLRATGRDVGNVVDEFASLADDPLKAVQELNQKYNFLNGTVLEQIRLLVEQGRTQDATRLAVNAYADAVDKRTPDVLENAGFLERAWRAVKNATREAADAALSLGRESTPQDRLAGLQGQRGRLQDQIDTADGGGLGMSAARRRITQARIAMLTGRIDDIAAAEATAQQQATKDAAEKRAVALQAELRDEETQYAGQAERRVKMRTQIAEKAAKGIADAQIAGDDAAAQNIAASRDRLLAVMDRQDAKSRSTVAGTAADLVRGRVDRELTELDRMYDRGLIKLTDYLSKRESAQRRALDAELKAAQAARNAAFEPEEIADGDAKIQQLLARQRELAIDSAFEAQTLARENADTLVEIKAQQLEQEGRLEEAARLRFELQYRELRQRLVTENNLAGVDLIDKLREAQQKALTQQTTDQVTDLRAQQLERQGRLEEAYMLRTEAQFRQLRQRLANDPEALSVIDHLIDVDRAQLRFTEIKTKFDKVVEDLQAKQESLANQVTVGAISPAVADEAQREARDVALQQLRELTAQMQALAAATGEEGLVRAADAAAAALARLEIEGATGLEAAINNLRASWDQMQRKFAESAVDAGVSSLTNFFTDLVTGAESGGDALKKFVLSFATSMAQIAARALATFLVLQLLDAVYPGLGQLTAATMQVGTRHDGGMVDGSGPKKNVSPLAFLKAPRAHTGTGILGLKSDEIPIIAQTGERIQSREEVAAMGKGGSGGSGVRIVNLPADDLARDYLQSSSGEEVILNILERNGMSPSTRFAGV